MKGHEFFASGNKDMLHDSLQQGITKEIYTRKMRIFNFIYEFTYLKRELIKSIFSPSALHLLTLFAKESSSTSVRARSLALWS